MNGQIAIVTVVLITFLNIINVKVGIAMAIIIAVNQAAVNQMVVVQNTMNQAVVNQAAVDQVVADQAVVAVAAAVEEMAIKVMTEATIHADTQWHKF